jgi:hypothetical protein
MFKDWLGVVTAAGVLSLTLNACAADGAEDTSTTMMASTTTTQAEQDGEATQATGGGEPRTFGYWVMWSGCDGSGSGAGDTVLMVDLLSDPGITLGNEPVDDCSRAVDVLEGLGSEQGPILDLAAQLLTAELNISSGAVRCPAIDQATTAAQLTLQQVGFDWEEPSSLADDVLVGAQDLTEALASYNLGELCQ